MFETVLGSLKGIDIEVWHTVGTWITGVGTILVSCLALEKQKMAPKIKASYQYKICVQSINSNDIDVKERKKREMEAEISDALFKTKYKKIIDIVENNNVQGYVSIDIYKKSLYVKDIPLFQFRLHGEKISFPGKGVYDDDYFNTQISVTLFLLAITRKMRYKLLTSTCGVISWLTKILFILEIRLFMRIEFYTNLGKVVKRPNKYLLTIMKVELDQAIKRLKIERTILKQQGT
jgi:hypothetical protein